MTEKTTNPHLTRRSFHCFHSVKDSKPDMNEINKIVSKWDGLQGPCQVVSRITLAGPGYGKKTLKTQMLHTILTLHLSFIWYQLSLLNLDMLQVLHPTQLIKKKQRNAVLQNTQ